FGAVCPERGTTAALVMPHADAQAMNAHLVEISKTVAEGAHAILVLDGAGWHGSKALCIPENITLLLPPPYAPELNSHRERLGLSARQPPRHLRL
ncbi:MAG: transposase, partial [Roseovarius sp.]|nr:transposase [Roseovarius sp.]